MTTTLLEATDRTPTGDLPPPTTSRWRPLRAGLQNIWQYDHTTRFVFHDGRLLLRGRNGVGKTKVVEVLLPFLLEGSMQPARLDPFGSRSRRMHYNLLHDGNADQQTAIGYVWLEFGRIGPDGEPEYATIGAGLQARRSTDQVESWFFTTSLRVDQHLDLVDQSRTPRSRASLEELLDDPGGEEEGPPGTVLRTARDYRTAVNRLLFDVPATQYEAMVDALLRLRQPHLSERLEPNQLDTVLSDSLPPLDEDRLREVAEGFDRLEAHRTELADRRRSLAAVEDFLALYTDYAAVVAVVRGRAVTTADNRVRGAAEAERTAREERDNAVADRDELVARIRHVDGQVRAAHERLVTLRQSDAYRAVQDLEQAEQQHADAQRRTREATASLDASRDDLDTATHDLEQVRRRLDERGARVAEAQRRVRAAAGDADLVDEHEGLVGGLAGRDDLDDDDAEAALATTRGTLGAIADDRDRAIARVDDANAELAEAQHRLERAQAARDDADSVVRDAAGAAGRAEEQATAAHDAFADELRDWADDATTVGLDEAAVGALADTDPEEASAAARAAAATRRDELDGSVVAARAEVEDVAATLAATSHERDELAAAAHQPPVAPEWRTADRAARPGAPFYLLVEFTDALAPQHQANVEAALDALGLLDAWVLPDGTMLGGDDRDLVVVEGSGAPGRTLADVARAVPTDGMWDDTMASVLQRIAVRDEAAIHAAADGQWDESVGDWLPDGGTAYVSTSGHFAMGPVDGRTGGTEVSYIGAAARGRARERALAELDARLADLDDRHATATSTLEIATARRRRFDGELDAFPSTGGVIEARAVARATARRLDDARGQLTIAEQAVATARHDLVEARGRRDGVALEVGLVAHVEHLGALADASRAWRDAVVAWVTAVDRWLDQRRHHAGATARLEGIHARARRDQEIADRATVERDRLAERVATLRDMVGAEADDIREQVRAAASERDAHDRERHDLEERRGPTFERVGAAERSLDHAQDEHARGVAHRDEVTASFVGLVDLGVLEVLDVGVDDDEHTWGVRVTLEHARRVVAAGPDLPDDPEALQARLERVENRLNSGQQQLLRDAVDIRPMLRRQHGVTIPEVRHAGRLQSLQAVAGDLRTEVTERDQRLHADEQGLLETFLTGELHEHLRARIRDAGALVDTMNDRLADCATTAGHRVRLRWEVADDAAPGTAEAIDLLLRGRRLITDDQRADLRSFLQERLRGARDGDAAASLTERIGNAFDYRRWHEFTTMFRDRDGHAWRRLTRQSHGAGSGGEKAVMLHLPLFAAMAAHYEAAPTGPRIIVLDEVFAGIDRETRGQLMGLLVELDLDALLTSHEEWGFYAELDGMSTYHLVRDPAMPGVLAEWFVWDGTTRWDMTT